MSSNILYIEDNPLNVRLVKRCLKHLPIHLDFANDGDVGIELLKLNQPDLILLDINLPTISGIDVLIHIKTRQQTKHIPVIALTADVTMQTRKLCEMYGASAYLQKPISRHGLIQVIQAYLPDVVV